MRRVLQALPVVAAILITTIATAALRDQASARSQAPTPAAMGAFDSAITQHAQRMIDDGRRIFRYDTFGDEAFWGDQLKLHQAIVGQKLGGVGPGLSPKMALGLGLKVDAAAVPANLAAQIKAGKVNMDDPASTVALLNANAVVGLTAFFNPDGSAKSVGVQCSICHSTVDDSFAPGIGQRLDGWPNRDLDVGAVIALAPDLTPFTTLLGVDAEAVRKVLRSWGPGKYDAELVQDGKTTRPDGKSAATLLPAAFGLAGVNLHTYTGWGSVTHWNAYVANTQLHGKGVFFDPRLNDKTRFPVAAKAGHGNMRNSPDLITPKLAALHFYQLAIPAPTPPAGSFDAQAAKRGEGVFNSQATCARCHVPPLFTEPGWPMHKAAEIGIDNWQAERSPDKEFYRTTPLRGLFTRMKGGFYHDGRFPTLDAVINHYDGHLNLKLTAAQKRDLIEYLKSL